MSGKPNPEPIPSDDSPPPVPFPLAVVITGRPMADGRVVADALARATGETYEMWWARQLRPGAPGLVICPKVGPSRVVQLPDLAPQPLWTSLSTTDDGHGLPPRIDLDSPSLLRGVAVALAMVVLLAWLAGGCAPIQEPPVASAPTVPAPKKLADEQGRGAACEPRGTRRRADRTTGRRHGRQRRSAQRTGERQRLRRHHRQLGRAQHGERSDALVEVQMMASGVAGVILVGTVLITLVMIEGIRLLWRLEDGRRASDERRWRALGGAPTRGLDGIDE